MNTLTQQLKAIKYLAEEVTQRIDELDDNDGLAIYGAMSTTIETFFDQVDEALELAEKYRSEVVR